MKTLTLNIGLNTNDGGKVALHTAILILSGRFNITHSRLAKSPNGDDECIVAVVEFSPYYVERLHELCGLLKQDCIATVLPTGHGELIGPKAEEWGDFNPEFFVPFNAPAKDDKPAIFGDFTIDSFCDYLENTIIPDSLEAGFSGYADDLQTALEIITHLKP